MKIILSILLVSWCTCEIILQSNTLLKLTVPNGQSVFPATAYTARISQAPDAVWIWSQGWNLSTCANPIIIQGSFFVDSRNPINFYGSADDVFALYIDGIHKITGNDYKIIHSRNFTLTCGIHTYRIVAQNFANGCSGNTAGLIFAFVQDSSTNQCPKKLPLVSNTQLKLSSPGHIGQAVFPATAYTATISRAPDAVWIWSQGWNLSTCVNPIIIQGSFIVDSGNPINFYGSADDFFTLQIDGKKIFQGNNYLSIFNTNFTLTCGIHTYRIVAHNFANGCSGNTAGLIFAFVQDSSYTIQCPKKLPLVSNTQLKLSSPGHIGQAVFPATAYKLRFSWAPDAVWIWSQGWNLSTCVNPIIIQGSFIVDSSNSINFAASADDFFTIQIDGKKILQGNNYLALFNTYQKLTCGIHTYRIVAHNFADGCSGNTAGLIFAFVQDSSTNQCPKKLPLVSNTQLKLSSPGHIGQAVFPATAYTATISRAPDAVWIWSQGWNLSTCVNPIIIQGSFIVDSGNPINFYGSADDFFTLQIDGKKIFQGNNYLSIFNTNFTLTCGIHTYRIVAHNFADGCSGNTAGLIFAFVQDSSLKTCTSPNNLSRLKKSTNFKKPAYAISSSKHLATRSI